MYAKVAARPAPTLLQRLQSYHSIGPIAGLLACAIAAWLHLYACWLEWRHPAASIERAVAWPRRRRQQDQGEEEEAGKCGQWGKDESDNRDVVKGTTDAAAVVVGVLSPNGEESNAPRATRKNNNKKKKNKAAATQPRATIT